MTPYPATTHPLIKERIWAADGFLVGRFSFFAMPNQRLCLPVALYMRGYLLRKRSVFVCRSKEQAFLLAPADKCVFGTNLDIAFAAATTQNFLSPMRS